MKGRYQMRVKTLLGAILITLLIVIPQSINIERVWGKESLNKENINELSEKWLTAVAKNDFDTALTIAQKLVSGNNVEIPLYEIVKYDLMTSIEMTQKLVPFLPGSIPQEHIKLSETEGIKASFFTAPFNYWDFNLWKHAYFFQKLSQKITGGDSNNIKAMIAAVQNHISPEDNETLPVAPWPYQIWQRGFGVCDRQAWVLCELAYQAGWETQIVYLRDPETKASPHTICELRKPGRLVYFADPFENLLFPQKSVEDVATNENLLQTLWPDNPERGTALQDSVFWTPSYPQDYCPRNQKLYKILQKSLKKRCPRFGVPPDARLMTYKQLRQRTVELGQRTMWGTLLDPPRFPMQLWPYPFRLLKADITRYCWQFGIYYLR